MDKINRKKDQLQRLFALRLLLAFSLSLSLPLVGDPYQNTYIERHATPLRGTPMGAYHGRQGELARSLLSCALLSSFAFVVVFFFFFAVSFESRSTHHPTIIIADRPRYSYRDSALICFSFRLGSLSRRDADMIGRANDSSSRGRRYPQPLQVLNGCSMSA